MGNRCSKGRKRLLRTCCLSTANNTTTTPTKSGDDEFDDTFGFNDQSRVHSNNRFLSEKDVNLGGNQSGDQTGYLRISVDHPFGSKATDKGAIQKPRKTTSIVKTINVHKELHVHEPKADAIVIGNHNILTMSKQEKDYKYEKSVEYVTNKIFKQELGFVRQQSDEILACLERMESQQSVCNPRNGTPSNNHATSFKQRGRTRVEDSDSYEFRRSKSNRKSRRKSSFKYDSKTHGLLQNMEWDQYEVSQQTILRKFACLLQKCTSVDQVEIVSDQIKVMLEDIISKKTLELNKSFSKSSIAKKRLSETNDGDWKENAINSLAENSTEVMEDAKKQILELKNERMNELQGPKSRNLIRPHIQETTVEEVEVFINFITDRTIKHVATLLPLAIQQEIVVFTFECQKSYVIKRIMKDFLNRNLHDSIKYILNPNDYARKWLFRFTNEKIFKKKSGKHLYAKFAETEIVTIFTQIRKSIQTASKIGENIHDWLNSFIETVHSSNVLPISLEELENVYLNRDLDLTRFISIINKRIGHMERGAVQTFINASVTNEPMRPIPHDKIFKRLWGCTECCPFCREPCQFTDRSHVKHNQKHRCIQHRPLGVYGFMEVKDSKLVTSWCNQFIDTVDRVYTFQDNEPFRPWHEYYKEFKDWKIEKVSSSPMPEPIFWLWFICMYKDQLKDVYGAIRPDIPQYWENITEKDAVQSLDSVYICG